MIEARELRIGNWANVGEHSKTPMQVEMFYGLAMIKFQDEFEEPEYPLEDCEPIKLTEEWLLRFGMDQQGSYEYKGLLYHNFGIDDRFDITHEYRETNKFIFSYDVGYGEIEKEIKHVHQLQNLYHALTGEELKIKEL